MAIEDVGARLILADQAAFVAGMDEAAASVERFNVAIAQAEAGSLALNERTTAGAAVSTTATAAATDAAVATDAAAAASARRSTAAADEEAAIKNTTKAATAHAGVLSSLASNPVIKATSVFGTGALAVGAYESIKKYTQFNQLVTQSSVDAGIKAKDLKGVQAFLLDQSAQYGVQMNDVANTWYRIASSAAGTHKTLGQMKEYTKDALKLDVLFNVPKGNATEQTSRIMGAMMNANMPGAKTPAQIMALMNAGVGAGDIRGQDMISALGKVLPAAKFTGVKAVDVVGWIDTLTKLGMQGSQAGTLINHSLQQLTTGSSEQAQKALVSIGIQPGEMSKVVTTKGLPAGIQMLMSAIAHGGQNAGNNFPAYAGNAPGQASASAQQDAWLLANPQAMADWRAGKASPEEIKTITAGFLSKMFGAAKSASPLLALASDPGKLDSLIAELKANSTPEALARSLALAENTPARQMQIAKASLAKSEVQVGAELTPAAVAGAHALKDVASYFAEHQGALNAVLAAVASFVGVAISVSVLDKLAKFAGYMKSIGSMAMQPISWLASLGKDAASTGAATTEETAAGTMLTASETMMAAAERMAVTSGGGALGKAEGGLSGLLGADGKPLASTAGAAAAGEVAGAGAAGVGAGEVAGAGAASTAAVGGAATGGVLAALAAPLAVAAAGIALGIVMNRDHKPTPQTFRHHHGVPGESGSRAGGGSPFLIGALKREHQQEQEAAARHRRLHPTPLTEAQIAEGYAHIADRESSREYGVLGMANWHRTHGHDEHGINDRNRVPQSAFGWTRQGPAQSRADAGLAAAQKAAATAQKQAAAKIAEAARLNKEAGQQQKDAARDTQNAGKTSGTAADKLKDSADAHNAAAGALKQAAVALENAAAKPVQAVVSAADISAAVAANNANTASRT